MSEKMYRDKIVAIKQKLATQQKKLSDARKAASKHRSEASRKLERIKPTTSQSQARMYQNSADSLEKRAQAEDKKVTEASKEISRLERDLANAQGSLEREERSTLRRREQSDDRRRRTELEHARKVARAMQPTVRYVHEIREIPTPRQEALRVLYLTADPTMTLRVEAEVNHVRQAIRGAKYREAIELHQRSAARPQDLLDGLNDHRPHVVHFSGHAGGAVLVFDNASVETPDERQVTFDLLARTLASTDSPPEVLVLNGCDTLDNAEVLLESVGAVIAMDTDVTDIAATAFATQFYAAIAAGQSLGSAVNQGSVAVDLLDLDEGWKPQLLVREGEDIEDRPLVLGEEAND